MIQRCMPWSSAVLILTFEISTAVSLFSLMAHLQMVIAASHGGNIYT